MTVQKQTGQRRTSAAHQHEELGADNPIVQKVGPLRPVFDQERCPFVAKQLADEKRPENERRARYKAERQNGMVARQQQRPVQRPSPQLAHGPDAQSFAREVALEHRAALEDAKQMRKAQYKAIRQYDDADRRIAHVPRTGDHQERAQLREIKRDVEGITEEANRSFEHFKHRTSPYLQ